MHKFDDIRRQHPQLFNNNNNNNIFIIVVVALGSFFLGYDACNYLNNRQQEELNNKKVEYELKQDIYKEHQIKDIKSKGKPQELIDFQDMDKKFYIHLENCEPLNIKTKNGYIEYIIDGITDDKCLFKHRQIGFMDKICAVPMEVAQKYSEEGMNIIRQLEELRAQNKSGFVDASKFINDIDNDKSYCRFEYYQRKK